MVLYWTLQAICVTETTKTEAAPTPVAALDVCPACEGAEVHTLFHASDRLYRTTEKSFCVVECKKCRLMRLSPQPTPEELKDYYPDNYWYVPNADAFARFVLRDHLRFVERSLRESGETGYVLDVGCGGGLFLKLLRRSGAQVVGLDFALSAAATAWKRNAVPAVCGTLSRPPFPPESCAIITMFNVLEHLYSPVSYLEAARGLLRPDGRLIIQVPNAACWQFLLLGANWSGVDVPRHLYDFRRPDLDALLERCGFEVLRHKYFSLRDNPAGFATSLAPSLDPVARRIRGVPETRVVKLLKDSGYFALMAVALPLTMFEAACRAGSTIMVEARKKS